MDLAVSYILRQVQLIPDMHKHHSRSYSHTSIVSWQIVHGELTVAASASRAATDDGRL